MLLVRQLTFGMKASFLGIKQAVSEGSDTCDYATLDQHLFTKGFSFGWTTYFRSLPFGIERSQLPRGDWIEYIEQ